ncbi:MAG: HigA family addiction module antidote protein, partial [Sphingomonas sp.]|nr:HigA family addiction module antidote protein [Sphingomonas sp.]
LLAEKQPVTVPMALRLAKLIGDTPEVWLNMQRAYDLRLAEREMAEEIAKIPTLRAA